MCHTPIVIRGLDVIRAPFSAGRRWKKNREQWKILSDHLLSTAILAWMHRPVASVIALDPLHWVMHLVSYRCISTARKMAIKLTLSSAWAMQSKYSTDDGVQWLWVTPWTPSICRCKWHRPAHQRRCWTGSDGGAFDFQWRFWHQQYLVLTTMLRSIKIKKSYHINLRNIFSLFVWFGCPLTTMDAILATIVIDRWLMLWKSRGR